MTKKKDSAEKASGDRRESTVLRVVSHTNLTQCEDLGKAVKEGRA